MPTYARKNVSFVKGHGAWLWDDKNEKYLDALSGIAVCGLGHAHAGLADTISQQANNLLHTSNLYRIPHQEALGDRMCEITGMQKSSSPILELKPMRRLLSWRDYMATPEISTRQPPLYLKIVSMVAPWLP